MTKLTIESPGRSQIRIQGHLDAYWIDRLGGLIFSVAASADGCLVTTLTGEVADQAALMGVLNTLYDLQYPLISVIYLEQEREPPSSD